MPKEKPVVSKIFNLAVFILLEIASLSMLSRNSELQKIWLARISHGFMAKTWGTTQSIYRYDGTNVGEGSLYALPKDLSCFAFAYNADLFDAAGLEYPDPENPYTYDEFLEVCKALTIDKDGDGEIDQWGVANANQFGMTPYLYSNGVQFLSDDMTKVNVANNQPLKNALEFLPT